MLFAVSVPGEPTYSVSDSGFIPYTSAYLVGAA